MIKNVYDSTSDFGVDGVQVSVRIWQRFTASCIQPGFVWCIIFGLSYLLLYILLPDIADIVWLLFGTQSINCRSHLAFYVISLVPFWEGITIAFVITPQKYSNCQNTAFQAYNFGKLLVFPIQI